MDGDPRRVFSIGHSRHPLDRFLALLQQHRIDVVADVRSHPHSRFSPHFNAGRLRAALRAAGMDHLFLGKELGGRPDGDDLYDAEGHVLYGRLAASAPFRDGLRRLEAGIGGHRIALLCAEEDPSGCHRNLLVGRVLTRRGILVDHIRGDGRLETQAELRDPERQRSLFEPVAETAWRSTQPVARGPSRSRSRPPPR